jgi:hypothetical protein
MPFIPAFARPVAMTTQVKRIGPIVEPSFTIFRTAMKTAIALATLSLLTTSAGAAERITEQRPVTAFTMLELSGPHRVVVHAHGTPGIRLEGEASELARIETVMRGDTLVVRTAPRKGFVINFGWHNNPGVVITVTGNALQNVKASGSGDVEIDQLDGDNLDIVHSGAGDLRARGTTGNLLVRNSGSGDVDLTGLSSAKLDVTMSGPGDVRLGAVGTELAATVSGSGDLTAHDLKLARASLRQDGPGDVRLDGTARDFQVKMNGSGDLKACNLAVESLNIVQQGPGNACVGGQIRELVIDLRGSGDFTAGTLQAQHARLLISGPGNANIGGSVGLLEAVVRGSGSLEGKGLLARRAIVSASGPGDAELMLGDANDSILTKYDRQGLHQR